MSGAPPPSLLTVQEASDLCRVAPATLRRAIARGEVDALRIGRVIRVPIEALTRPERAAGRSAGDRGHRPAADRVIRA
jgi:excisionase family DNA binding protein